MEGTSLLEKSSACSSKQRNAAHQANNSALFYPTLNNPDKVSFSSPYSVVSSGQATPFSCHFMTTLYNSMDKSPGMLYQNSLGGEEKVDVVARHASKPYAPNKMWPVPWLCMVLTWAYGTSSFTVERNAMKKLRIHTRVIRFPCKNYVRNYGQNWEKEAVNSLIINAVCEADRKGAEVG